VSVSNLDSVKHHIDHQEEHHRKIDFATEWKLLLEKHGVVLPARLILEPSRRVAGLRFHLGTRTQHAACWAIGGSLAIRRDGIGVPGSLRPFAP
jgi:hypothetical protein